MKIIGNRTKITLAVAILVEGAKAFGLVDAATADQLRNALLAIAAYFFADKVQANVEAQPSGDPRVDLTK